MKESNPIVNPYIFRMYDIRGVVDQDITTDVAQLIGLAFGTFIRRSTQTKACIAVGSDNRPSSSDLHYAVCDGLMKAGCDVLDVGLTPSPVLSFAVAHWSLDGGINVTGSHNPLNQNGFKLEGPRAYPIAEEDIQTIRELVEKRAFALGQGKITVKDPRKEYLAKLLKLVTIKRKVKVVIDCGNGVAGLYAPTLLHQLGCEVVELYCELDSSFPHHLPNPEDPRNMHDLQQAVTNVGADIGIAYDGDADRIGAVNEHGELVVSDYIIILLSRDLLTRHPGESIVIDVKSSQAVIDDIEAHGGTPIMWKTGHSLIRRKMHQDGILFAGEFSGHMFFGENYYTIDDAILASCRLLQILSSGSATFSSMLSGLPKRFTTGLIEAHCSDRDKFEVIARVTDFFSKKYDVLTIDGARIMFNDGWAVVRASNTTPTLTLRFEADTEERLKEIQSIVFDKLSEFPSVQLPNISY